MNARYRATPHCFSIFGFIVCWFFYVRVSAFRGCLFIGERFLRSPLKEVCMSGLNVPVLQGRAIALTVRDGEEKVLLLFRETVYGTLVPCAILNWPERFSRSGLTRSKTKRFTSLMPKPNGKGIGEIATESSDTISKLHVKLNLKRIGILI